MKKYISLIGALALGTTGSLSVVACGPNSNNEGTPTPLPGTENIKAWSNQTSNIAKSIILSKNENFNTNNLLNKTLNNIENNIEKNTDPNTGTSYDSFKSIWGYKSNDIEGLTAADFNNDTSAAIDNNQIATKNSITATLKDIQSQFGLIQIIAPQLTSNEKLSNLLNGFLKSTIVNALWPAAEGLKGNTEIIQTIKSFAPMVQTLVDNLSGFNAKDTLGEYYVDGNITESLFGKDGNNGWLHNYQSFGGFTSEAATKNSSILQDKNLFQTWDQVALFKASIDLNGLVSQWSGGKLTLGEIFENAMDYDEASGQIKSIDFNVVAEQIQSIWTTTPDNIVNLISTLIPVIKTQFLKMSPTTAITKITTSEATDVEKGILNLTDIISIIENVILTKDGFTNFISDLFFPETAGKFKLGNYATFDFTSHQKSLSEVILPIKESVLNQVGSLYTNSFEPLIEKFGIREICKQIKEFLVTWTQKNKTEINLSDVQGIAKILNNQGLYDFLTKLSSYENKDAFEQDWMNLWGTLGLQDPSEKDFIPGSVLEQLAQTLIANPDLLKNIEKLLNLATGVIPIVMDTIVESETTNLVNWIKNEAKWGIDETTIQFSYNSKADETTIYYNLTDKTSNKTYQIVTVVKGNADTPLDKGTKQVWLKTLKAIN